MTYIPEPETRAAITASGPRDGSTIGLPSSTLPAIGEFDNAIGANWSMQARFPLIRWLDVILNGSYPNRKHSSIAIGCALTSRSSGALNTPDQPTISTIRSTSRRLAQNDAMLDAYLDGMDYYFRVNDDTILESRFWTERYIQTLGQYNPSNVGVVGPRHIGGNYWILTYDFVHRTHIDIFGYYYPRVFTDWFADGWITGVYAPNRTTKVTNALLTHQTSIGHRYSEDESKRSLKDPMIAESRKILQRLA
ncbi:hypothetical protein LSH36_3409g00000 [Paralvinella palmiformis]|uniref:Uncharacterized protein n=1 Tax=Paralvinella palmiformis TaxID=53620 RepID=A0AAD9IQQ1_9ANNE|nr:hypothetical protein LSH36_3409g00000 [Paralvinella palmiformis]